jgi:SPP1 family predicted phage head-tail adaptor
MRAGKLDRQITIQSFSSTIDVLGTPTVTWTTIATVRAQVIEVSTEEYQRAYGEGGNTSIIFRIRFLAGVTTDHRVQYEGKDLNIRELKEIGRGKGLELRCEEVRT